MEVGRDAGFPRGKQTRRNVPKSGTTGLTRRNVLKAGVFAAANLGIGAAIPPVYRHLTRFQSPSSEPPSPPTSSQGNADVSREVISPISRESVIYSYIQKPEEKQRAIELIEKQRAKSPHYTEDPNHPDILRTREWKNLVHDVVEKENVKSPLGKEWLEKAMLGLIFTENKGRPKTDELSKLSGNKGIGLCQLEANAISDAREWAHLPPNINPEDPKTNITLAVHYLNHMFNLYGDPTLALWAYNLGPGNMNDAIATYARSKAKTTEEIRAIDDTLSRSTPQEPYGTKVLVKRYDMNGVNVSTSDAVTAKFALKDPQIQNTTYEYVPRIALATQLLAA